MVGDDMVKLINDAGHGGGDSGAVSGSLMEKTLTLEASKYVNTRLMELGLNNTATRYSDLTLTNNQRVNMIRGHERALSHHFNSGGGSGLELIVSQHSNREFENLIVDEFKKMGYPIRPRSIYDRKNSRGGDYYYLHRLTGNTKVTIIEYDFLDGPNHSKLKSLDYREGMYECVVKAVCRYYNVPYKTIESGDTVKDLDKNRYSYDDIIKVVDSGIMSGYPDETFRPNEPVTREQLAIVISRLLDKME